MELDSQVTRLGVAHHARPPRAGKARPRVLLRLRAEFDAMVQADAFVEWAHVHGRRYGTSKKAIEERIAQGPT
jgi:guanylate kinase